MGLSKYIKKKQQLFSELGIPLTDENLLRMKACDSEITVDNIAHTIIMNHKYSTLVGGRS